MSPTPSPGPVSGFFETSAWEGWATILAAVIAAVIIVIGFVVERRLRRRSRRAETYAGALQAVSDYLEAPYRIRRRSGTAAERVALTDHICDVQSRLDFFAAHIALLGPDQVYEAFAQLVTAAKSEAGPQMTAAWRARPTRRDRDVPLVTAYAHPRSDIARDGLLALMERAQ